MTHEFTIPVDFGNRDDDGPVRLVTRGAIDFLEMNHISLENGQKVLMSDGELFAIGHCIYRDWYWAVVIEEWID